ncbi:MAG: ASKHA domain-containing protein [bacterium]
MSRPVRVVFTPDSKEVWVVSGSTVADALLAASIPIMMPCGGHGRCGKCLVEVRGLVSKPSQEELALLAGKSKGLRLACMTRIEGNTEVFIPHSSRSSVQMIKAEGKASGNYRFHPGVAKLYVGSEQSSEKWKKLESLGIGPEEITLCMMDKRFSDQELLNDPHWNLGLRSDATVVVIQNEIVSFEAGNTESECYGVAIDIGTNTIVCSLVDLSDGRELATASAVNPQVAHGDDVVSRIRFCKKPGGLDLLRFEVIHIINGLVEEVTSRCNVASEHIYLYTAVGNSAMQHIFLGVSPVDLGRAPYRSKLTCHVDVPAKDLSLPCNRVCRLLMPKSIGGFVGSDLVAFIVSQALHKRSDAVLGIDLGTNGEIVLAKEGKIYACSTACGPAFEGERIVNGIRAVEGAIEDVRVAEDRIFLKTIGDLEPIGICGSGLVAAIAELLNAGVIEKSGRIKSHEEMEHGFLKGLVVEGARGRELLLSEKPGIVLTQSDIREVQLAKAAIAAGIRVLAELSGTRIEEIATAYVGGGFGSSLEGSRFLTLGFLPQGFKGDVVTVGNAAIEGAKMILTSIEAREAAKVVSEQAEHIELFTFPGFKAEFYKGIPFP